MSSGGAEAEGEADTCWAGRLTDSIPGPWVEGRGLTSEPPRCPFAVTFNYRHSPTSLGKPYTVGINWIFQKETCLRLEVILEISEVCTFRRCGWRYQAASLTFDWFSEAWMGCVCVCVCYMEATVAGQKNGQGVEKTQLCEGINRDGFGGWREEMLEVPVLSTGQKSHFWPWHLIPLLQDRKDCQRWFQHEDSASWSVWLHPFL